MNLRSILSAAGVLGAAFGAQALTITSLTPQGEVAISDREWAFQFAQDLPPGVRCTLQPRADFKSPKGEPLSAAVTYTFNTGGPFVQHIRPGTYQRIEEEQPFLMQLKTRCATLHSHAPGASRPPRRCRSSLEKAWRRPAACPIRWKSALPSRCASRFR